MNDSFRHIGSRVRCSVTTMAVIPGLLAVSVSAADDSLQAANRTFANPLASSTLWITENNTFVLDGDAVSDSRRNNVTIIDPLIPQSLGDSGWSLVHRPIVPIWSSQETPNRDGGFDSDKGLGDITYFAAFTPEPTPIGDKGNLIWGAGPIVRFPTGGSDLGAEKYSAGGVLIGLYSAEKFTAGFLNQNLFSFAGDSDRDSVQSSTLQYFYFYNFTPKWGIGAAPTMSFDWEDSDNTAIPIGFGVTRSFFTGKTPNRLLFEVDYYVDQNDDFGPEWNFRIAWGRVLPKWFD